MEIIIHMGIVRINDIFYVKCIVESLPTQLVGAQLIVSFVVVTIMYLGEADACGEAEFYTLIARWELCYEKFRIISHRADVNVISFPEEETEAQRRVG